MTIDTSQTDAEYLTAAHATLDRIEARVDQWLQDDVIDIDTHRTGGLLQMTFPDGSQIILNTQPPLRELWMAARGGGFHYKRVDGDWRDTKDPDSRFLDALAVHASRQAGQALRWD
ncbi:MAG: iron donor protein CyaY [Pseudomonadota bacterium]